MKGVMYCAYVNLLYNNFNFLCSITFSCTVYTSIGNSLPYELYMASCTVLIIKHRDTGYNGAAINILVYLDQLCGIVIVQREFLCFGREIVLCMHDGKQEF